MKGLVDFLECNDLDAYLIVADSICDADLFYASGFIAGDRFTYIVTRESDLVLVSEMEVGRARKESRVGAVRSLGEFNFIERAKETGDAEDAYIQVLGDLFGVLGVKTVGVPRSFPYYLGGMLVDSGISLKPFKSPIAKMREVKTPSEIGNIEAASQACIAVIDEAIRFLEGARVVDGVLKVDGTPVTSERVRALIEGRLAQMGYDSDQIIVAAGVGSADPHWVGEGPINVGEPVVIDVFPRNKHSRYHSDMTRTVSVGKPSSQIIEMYEAVEEALDEGIGAITPGIKGSEVHEVVSSVLEERGFDTLRQGKGVGFIHSTGHGVGLAVHEGPSLSMSGEELQAGNVVTVEPGLYYPGIGGVRLEDLVVVTDSGARNLTQYERRLTLSE